MKNILKFAAALAVMVTVSCNKEMNPSEGVSPEGNTVKVTMNATTADQLSKVTLNGKRFEWEVGDQLQTSYYTGTPLTAISAGSGATFEGEASGFPASKGNMYVFYTVGGTVSGANCTKEIPSVQSGLSTDIKNYGVWSSWVTPSNQHYFDAEGNEISSGTPSSVEIDAEMVSNFSVLKFTVPQELGLTSIAITADAKIAGTLKVFAARKPTTTGSSSPADRISRPTASGQYETITVSRNGEVISGDVYVVIAPDAFDSEPTPTETSWELYYNTATSLNFTFTNESGNAEYQARLSDPIQMGELKDLGSLPVNMMTPRVEAGELRLTDATTLTVGVDNPNLACTYYYEIGASKAECKTPTTASASFDPLEGFCPEITGSFDRYFIKVLAHTEDPSYRDVVMTASLRNWKFYQGCPVDAVLSKMESGEKLPAVGDTESISHGLELRRNTLKAAGNYDIGPYESNAARIAYTTARVQINAITEYASDAWITFYIDKNTCVGVGGKRGYRFYYNNSQSTSSYWEETINSTLTEENSKNEKHTICHHLNDIFGSVKVGDKFGLRGDGKHVYYGMAMLEVL